MNLFQHELDLLKAGIAQALPGVHVRGSLVEHEELRRDELLIGVVTVLLERIKAEGEWDSYLQVLIPGQVEVVKSLPADDMGEKVEAAELALYSKLRAYLRNTGGLPHVAVNDVQFSAQSKVPFGWFLLRAQYGPMNEACLDWDFGSGDVPDGMYPPNVRIGDLNQVHLFIDAEPHEHLTEHEKWLAGDESTSQPDLKTTVELNK